MIIICYQFFEISNTTWFQVVQLIPNVTGFLNYVQRVNRTEFDFAALPDCSWGYWGRFSNHMHNLSGLFIPPDPPRLVLLHNKSKLMHFVNGCGYFLPRVCQYEQQCSYHGTQHARHVGN